MLAVAVIMGILLTLWVMTLDSAEEKSEAYVARQWKKGQVQGTVAFWGCSVFAWIPIFVVLFLILFAAMGLTAEEVLSEVVGTYFGGD